MGVISTAPAWVREIDNLLPICSQFLLSGNIHDQYLVPELTSPQPASSVASDSSDSGPPIVVLSLRDALRQIWMSAGATGVLSFDIAHGVEIVSGSAETLTEVLGADPSRIGGRNLEALLELITRCGEPAASGAVVPLIIRSASRLVRNPNELDPTEYDFFRAVNRLARQPSAPRLIDSTGRRSFSHIVWVLDHERDVPHWFVHGNVNLRSVVIPMPDSDDRSRLARRNVAVLRQSEGAPVDDVERAAAALAAQSSGLSLMAMDRVLELLRDQDLPLDQMEDAARSYRVGVVENPWRGNQVRGRIRSELMAGADGQMRGRVLGQDAAIDKTLDILARSVAGLTAAQAGQTASRPRGVLFFAGPTGVGKTELAKAVTRLLFDDERAYLRFDMSEFSAEHAADRLIGAPPGYIGFEAGGELTNAIRQQPFSVVLFDEIEKAHPRILDKFLQVLDDGRLTDGRGETVFFTEAVIIFTSNLGMYEDIEEQLDDGSRQFRRRLTVDPEHTPYPEMVDRITEAVRAHFTIQIGRPELLNRIGDNIVVFDFVRPGTAGRILDMMLDNVVERVRREHGVELTITDETRALLRDNCVNPKVLEMGGRGVGAQLETVLINPLSRAIVMADDLADVIELQLHRGSETIDGGAASVSDVVQWTVTLR